MRNLLVLGAILLGALPLIGSSSAASAANADSGRSAYANSCANCHSNPQSYRGASAPTIQSAIQNNRGGMGRLATLSTAELQDIAAYLANPAATTVAVTTPPATPPSPAISTTDSDADRIFDWAESAYPQQFGSHGTSRNVGGYYLRHYPGTDVYLATLNGRLYFYNAGRPEEGALELGSVSDWLNRLTPPTATQGRPDDHDDGDGDEDENHDGQDDDGYDEDGHRDGNEDHDD